MFFSQKRVTSSQPQGGDHLLHRSALPRAQASPKGNKGMRHFIIAVPLSKEKTHLARVQLSPTCLSISLCALPAWHLHPLWGWRDSAVVLSETLHMR